MGLIKKMTAFAKRVFPEKFLQNLDRRLESTKIALTAEEYVGVTLLATIIVGLAAGFIGMLLKFPLPAPLFAILVAVATFPGLTIA